MKSTEYVKASELGNYVYCPRAWWLNFNGKSVVTEYMMQGTAEHNTLAKNIETFNTRKILAWVLIVGGILIILIYFLLFK